jgi:hypothetical protein
MAARVRLATVGRAQIGRIPPRVRLSLLGLASAVVLGAAAAALASGQLGRPAPSQSAQPAPTAAAVSAPRILIGAPATLTASLPPTPETHVGVSADGTLGMAVEFVPTLARVGTPLVMRFTVRNQQNAAVNTVEIDATGPWAGYDVQEVSPAGSFERVSDTRATIRSALRLAAQTSGGISLRALPNQPGDGQFTFVLQVPDRN